MAPAIAILLLLATAPIHLLPAILAVFLRLRGAAWMVLANLGIWLGLPISQGLNIPIQLSVVSALILWLLLLRVVLKRDAAR